MADSPNAEIRVRWTGTARFDPAQAEWAMRVARSFVVGHAPDRAARTGLRRSVLYTGGLLAEAQAACVYFTPGGVVVVRIHGVAP